MFIYLFAHSSTIYGAMGFEQENSEEHSTCFSETHM